jgi:hypothetical protein
MHKLVPHLACPPTQALLVDHLRLTWCSHTFFWNHNPQDDVDQHSRPSCQGDQHKEQTNPGRINAEVLTQSGTDTPQNHIGFTAVKTIFHDSSFVNVAALNERSGIPPPPSE